MVVDEIFSKVSAHMVKGMMFHDQMMRYYNFLGLCGFGKCHEWHFIQESKAYRKLNKFFTEHYGRLIPEASVDDPKAIPDGWYAVSRNQVDQQRRMTAVKTGVTSWIAWESTTKSVYQNMEKELIDMGETNAAHHFACLVNDVSHELKVAEKKSLLFNSVNFDASFIVSMQDELYEKYKEMIKHA